MGDVYIWVVCAAPVPRVISPAFEFLSGFPSGSKTVMLPANFMANLKSTNPATPADLGCSMPAEWETHAATWLAWPHHEADWPGKMEAIRWVYGEMVRKISPGEIVRILVRHQAEEKLARRLSHARGLRFEEGPSSSCIRPIAAGCATADRFS